MSITEQVILHLSYWVPFVTLFAFGYPIAGILAGLISWVFCMCVSSKRHFGKYNFVKILLS